MPLPIFGGTSDQIARHGKLQVRIEQLEAHGYKTKKIDEDRKFWWRQRCPLCNKRGLAHIAREFSEGPVYSLEAYAYCIECGYHDPC